MLEKSPETNWHLNETDLIITLLYDYRGANGLCTFCGAMPLKEFSVLQFPGQQFELHVVMLIQQNTVYIHRRPPLAQKKCFPCVDRVLIKGFWTYWLEETTVTKLLSYFCSLTKVSAISGDLVGSCAAGHAVRSGLGRMGTGGGGEGMLA